MKLYGFRSFYGNSSLLLFFVTVFGILSPIPLVFRNFLWRNGVIAARREGLAAKDPPHGQSETHKKATFGKRLDGVGRAGRGKPTAGISF